MVDGAKGGRFKMLRERVALGVCLCATSACVGTPTPEPPDFLKRPDGDKLNQDIVTAEGGGTEEPVPIYGAPGAVTGDSDVWLVNLDNDAVEPVTVRAEADGSFSADIRGVPGERIRLVSRTAELHSLPLDLEVRATNQVLGVIELGDTSLSCVTVEPSDELSLVAGQSRAFTLTNDCDEALNIERAALRFADQGFSLLGAVPTIAVGEQARLTVEFASEAQGEQADILLLEVAAGDERGRYALGVWGRRE